MRNLIQLLKYRGIDDPTLIAFTTGNRPSREAVPSEACEPDVFSSFGPFDGNANCQAEVLLC